MKQGIDKAIYLPDLLVKFTDKQEQDDTIIERIGRKMYDRDILFNSRNAVYQAHDKQKVYFWRSRFDHAFFITPQKTQIDRTRVKRIRWILPLIQGKVPNSECWLVEHGTRPTNRLYVWLPANFLVWLEPRNTEGWRFSTLYTTYRKKVREHQRSGKRIWCYK